MSFPVGAANTELVAAKTVKEARLVKKYIVGGSLSVVIQLSACQADLPEHWP